MKRSPLNIHRKRAAALSGGEHVRKQMSIQRYCYIRMRPILSHLHLVISLGFIVSLTIYLFYQESAEVAVYQESLVKPVVRTQSMDESSLTPQQRHIKNVCRRHKHPTTMERIEPEKLVHFIVDDKYKLLYCQIPKVATTTWRRLFLILTGKVGTSDPMALSANAVHHDLNKHLTYLSNLPEKEIEHRLKTYFKFVFVREPFERVLSAFRNKFDHHFEGVNYVQNLFQAPLIRHYRKNKTNVTGDPKRVTFPEFVDYLVDPDPYIPTNEHWEQFYSLCLPCVIDFDFIGKLESIQTDSDFVLKKKGLDRIVKFPSRKEATYDTNKTTTHLKDYYSRISQTKLRNLWTTYQEDFEIFNYTIPTELKDMMS